MDYRITKSKLESLNCLQNSNDYSHAQIADTLRYLREQNYSDKQIQAITQISLNQIRQYLRLSKRLSNYAKESLDKKKISFSLARVIASVPMDAQEEIIREVFRKKLSVHRLRKYLTVKNTFIDDKEEQFYEQLAIQMSEQTGLIVRIEPNSVKSNQGRLTLTYTSLDDFSAICERLNITLEN